MSELTLFESGLPAYLKEAELDATTRAIAGNVGQYKRLSIKGSVFRLYINGKEMSKSENRSMDVVIVAAAPKVSRTWYAKSYVEGSSIAAPDCFSNDGESPDAKSSNPQAAKCYGCKQNENGSGANGSRACRFNQKLAIVSASDIGGDVLQLQLPGQSIFGAGEPSKLPLQAYTKFIAGKGVPITAVVTEMRFDTDVATPKLVFKPKRILSKDEYDLAVVQGKSDDAKKAIEFTPAEMDKVKFEDKPIATIKYDIPEPIQETTPKPKVIKAKDKAPDFDEEIIEPVVRALTKAKPVESKKDLSSLLDEWDE